MKITVPSFPVLTDSLVKKCVYSSSEFSFSYLTQQGKRNELSLKPATIASEHSIPNFNLKDENAEWDATHFETSLDRTISLGNPGVLFGPNGVAPSDARLGIAVMVISLSSNHRYARPVITFTSQDNKINGKFTFEIPQNFFRDKINLRTVLYLYEAGHPTDDEINLANIPGTILGTFDEIGVYIDGTGSLFPVKKESDPTKPLWRVQCDWSDPFNDLFNEENVCIIFNSAHPNYGLLKIEEGMNGSPFLADVIASALHIIILKTIESVGGVDELLSNDSSVPGSILDAVQYFIRTFGWNPSSPEVLAETIRADFDRRTQKSEEAK